MRGRVCRPSFQLVRTSVAGMRRPTPVGLEEIGHHGKDGKDGKDERSLGFANRSEASRNWLDMPFRRTHAKACERRPESTSWGSLVRAQYGPPQKPPHMWSFVFCADDAPMRRCPCESCLGRDPSTSAPVDTQNAVADALAAAAGGVRKRRRRLAADDRRDLVTELVVLGALHHEQHKADAARESYEESDLPEVDAAFARRLHESRTARRSRIVVNGPARS